MISTFGSLDYEMQPGYELVVSCNDNGTPPMQNITFVYVQLMDVNDNPPVFMPPRDSFGLSRLAPAGTIVYYARVSLCFLCTENTLVFFSKAVNFCAFSEQQMVAC